MGQSSSRTKPSQPTVTITRIDGSTKSIKVLTGIVSANILTKIITIKSVKMSEGVTAISKYAFRGCSSLTSVVIPNSVIVISEYVFLGCSSLTSVNIPNSVTTIGCGAIEDCSSLISVKIPDGVTEIGSWAFSGCSSLTSVKIPEGVTQIGKSAFDGCSSLTSVEIPDSVTQIGVMAFQGCSSLISVKIPDSVTAIGAWAFEFCSSLISVVIPEGVTEIAKYAFYGCSSLTSVEIPNSVTEIGYSAFQDCIGLTSVKIPDGVTAIGDFAFFGCSSLTSVVIPEGVTVIEYGAFSGCDSLTSVEIPDGVTEIGRWAFSCCIGLTSVVIPNSVTEIGYAAFSGCSSLKVILCADAQFNEFPSNVMVLDHNFELLRLPEGMTEAPPKPDHFSQMSHDAKLMYHVTAMMGDVWPNMDRDEKIDFIKTTDPTFTAGELKQLDLVLYQSFVNAPQTYEENVLDRLPLADVQSLHVAVCPNSISKGAIDFSYIFERIFEDAIQTKGALERRSNPKTIRSFLLFCHRMQAAYNDYLADYYRPSVAQSEGHLQYMFHQLTQRPLLPDWATIFKTPLVLPKRISPSSARSLETSKVQCQASIFNTPPVLSKKIIKKADPTNSMSSRRPRLSS